MTLTQSERKRICKYVQNHIESETERTNLLFMRYVEEYEKDWLKDMAIIKKLAITEKEFKDQLDKVEMPRCD